jgi:hypothetical protein
MIFPENFRQELSEIFASKTNASVWMTKSFGFANNGQNKLAVFANDKLRVRQKATGSEPRLQMLDKTL